MAYTIQRKITTGYSLWLFATVMLIFAYVLLIRGVFMTYAEAMPWINGYLILAILGNIGALAAVVYFLQTNQEALKFLAIYEVAFIVILVLAYLIVSGERLPEGIALFNLNFETVLNAVLPVLYVCIVLFEFVFSKALRLMAPKMR